MWQMQGRAGAESPPGGDIARGVFHDQAGDALDSLRDLVAASRLDIPAGLPPPAAGLFGVIGYDMVRLVERLPNTPRSSGPARRRDDAAGRGGDLRRHRPGDHPGHHRSPFGDRRRPRPTPGPRRGSRRSRPTSPSRSPAPRRRRRPRAPAPAHVRHRRRRLRQRSSSAPSATSRPATSSRWCRATASPRPTPARRSRSTARCGGPIRRRSCTISTSRTSSWWGRRRRSWSACATARSPSAPSPAPAAAARRRRRIWPSRSSCWPMTRSAPST